MAFFKRNKNPKTEKEIILLAQKDSRYFAPIYKKYHEQIFRFIYQRMDREEDVADLTSQVFLKALVNLKKYQFRGFPFSSWLYKIALNEVNQFYRKNKKQRVVSLEEHHLKALIEESNSNENKDQKDSLLKVLGGLDSEKIALIELRFFEKRAFKEIGRILNITENNAKVKTYRILEEIKQQMSTIDKKGDN